MLNYHEPFVEFIDAKYHFSLHLHVNSQSALCFAPSTITAVRLRDEPLQTPLLTLALFCEGQLSLKQLDLLHSFQLEGLGGGAQETSIQTFPEGGVTKHLPGSQ